MNKELIAKIENKAALFVLGLLPSHIREEIERTCKFRRDFPEALGEVRITSFGKSSIILSGECIPLFCFVGKAETDGLFDRITAGSRYAYVKSIKEGFVSLDYGIRVGVCSSGASNGGVIDNADTLVFRIPCGKCSFAGELTDIYKKAGTAGMLLFSPPGMGKTTALRQLCADISKRLTKKVVVIDERHEFIYHDYSRTMVDIVTGVSKSRGIEIAQRTLGAEVIVVDEIGSADECEALLRVGRGGVPIIASCHAASVGEVLRKEGISQLIREGYFNRLIRLYKDGGSFLYADESDMLSE